MRITIAAVLIVVAALALCNAPAELSSTSISTSSSHAIYQRLSTAQTDDQVMAALKVVEKIDQPLPPPPPQLRQRIIQGIQEKMAWPENGLIGRLAALCGDVKLLRVVVFTYGGEAEAEVKGGYIEEFLTRWPALFFSLPDTWAIWKQAGGAQDCLYHPEKSIPVIWKYARYTNDGKRIQADIKAMVAADKEHLWDDIATAIRNAEKP